MLRNSVRDRSGKLPISAKYTANSSLVPNETSTYIFANVSTAARGVSDSANAEPNVIVRRSDARWKAAARRSALLAKCRYTLDARSEEHTSELQSQSNLV